MLKDVKADTTGVETALRVVGTRDPLPKMLIQIEVKGTANVQVQGRVARDAPWVNIGAGHTESALVHLDPVQFLRAVSSGMSGTSSVTVWAVWGW